MDISARLDQFQPVTFHFEANSLNNALSSGRPFVSATSSIPAFATFTLRASPGEESRSSHSDSRCTHSLLEIMAQETLEAAFDIIRIFTTGIPILSTELCAKNVSKALYKGIFYAAAAPMTIFGSFGIAKAGLIALCASIDHQSFPGPALLEHTGFRLSGMGKRFLHVKTKKQHLYKAEDRLRTMFHKKKVTEVKVNLWSLGFWSWNLKLAILTATLSTLGMIPYIVFIQIFLVERSLLWTWFFPLARLLGSGVVVVNVQFLYQLRLMEEVYYRLRFIAADNYLKQMGKSLPAKWDPNGRSKNILTGLALEWSHQKLFEPLDHIYQLDEADMEKILDGAATLTSFDFNIETDALSPVTTPSWSHGDTTLQSTTIAATPALSQSHKDTPHPTPHVQDTQDTKHFIAAEQGASVHEYPPETPRVDSTASTRSRITMGARAIRWIRGRFTTVIVWGIQITLLSGILLTVLGYIGCAIIVGSSPSHNIRGPLVWLACEAVLFGLRISLWASKPEWDDAPLPIVLEKSKGNEGSNSSPTCGAQGPASIPSLYGIGWALKSSTPNDMHALIIGVNNCNTTDFEDFEKAKSDAESVVAYLRDTLLVPPSQIRTLYDTDATRSRIVEELKSLRHRGSVTPDAPIVIYYAGHSFVAHESTYLVPHLPHGDKLRGEPKDYCLPYSEIVDLLRHVADEKGDNIVVILDTCHAGALGYRFDSQHPQDLTSQRLSKPKSPEGLHWPYAEQLDESSQLQRGNLSKFSRVSDNDGGNLSTLASLLPSSGKETEEPDRLLRVDKSSVQYRGKRKRPRKVTNATTEILIGHSSHILLAGADASQQAYEDPVSGGRFTQMLLDVLRDAGREGGDLQTMTYKRLVERINERFAKIEADPRTGRSLLDYQIALCTTIHQDCYLFDGLFRRKVDNRSSQPLMRVLYSD